MHCRRDRQFFEIRKIKNSLNSTLNLVLLILLPSLNLYINIHIKSENYARFVLFTNIKVKQNAMDLN